MVWYYRDPGASYARCIVLTAVQPLTGAGNLGIMLSHLRSRMLPSCGCGGLKARSAHGHGAPVDRLSRRGR